MDLDNPHTDRHSNRTRGLPTFPQALRLITRSRETNPRNGQAIRQTRLSLLRQWHGWTIDEYREAFQLRQTAPTCSHELSDRLGENARARAGRNGFAIPPSTPEPAANRVPRWRSLSHLHPELLAELHPTRNRQLDVSTLAAGSHRKVWWRCQTCRHEWQAAVANRLLRGSGCPECALKLRAAKRRRVDRERSIALTRPDLTEELHPALNGQLDPYALGSASTQKLWWQCRTCGHEWQATVANRTSGTGCPACWQARRGAVFSTVHLERSLAARAPRLLRELHPTRNPNLDPSALGARSDRKMWWRCNTCGHEWQARVASRSSDDGCPECARRRQRKGGPRPVPSERSLAAKAPELLLELHPRHNPGLNPYTVGARSSVTAWWRCGTCGHQWQARIANRSRGSGCPACARHRTTTQSSTTSPRAGRAAQSRHLETGAVNLIEAGLLL
jgi:predicted  nucleic acid-binding Zn-ribbon protein